MLLDNVIHKGYQAHLEFGTYVWYKTTRSVAFAVNKGTGKEQRTGTNLDRIVTTAKCEEAARVQLDRALMKPKKPKEVPDPDQGKLF